SSALRSSPLYLPLIRRAPRSTLSPYTTLFRSELVRNTDFGTFDKTSDDPLTVNYKITADAVWSDGVPIDEADMLMHWAAMGGLVEGGWAPAATTGWNLITQTPEIAEKEITLVYDEQYVDWELIQPLGVSAHGTYALAYPDEYADVQAAWDTYKGSQSDDDFTKYSDAAKSFAETAKQKVIDAITNGDTEVLTKLATAWNDAYV